MYKFLTLFCCLFSLSFSLTGQTIFVKQDATGANNGSSWADAYTKLHVAIENAPEGADVWIAAGIYIRGEQNRSFYLTRTMNLYGGFAGTETSFNERNITENPTILSADNNSDDLPDDRLTNRSDNSTHVLFFENDLDNIIVDGLTIKGGHTNRGEDPSNLVQLGGGIYSEANSFTVRNCTILENSAAYGGGIHVHVQPNAQVLIEDCIIKSNGADFRGGGFYHRSPNANITIRNTVFDDNLARFGAAVYFGETDANLTIENCTFTNGLVIGLGGAVYITLAGQGAINNSTFDSNRAFQSGGALFVRNEGTLVTVNNCNFRNNSVTQSDPEGRGGAIFCGVDGKLTLNSCNILNNTSMFLGGGIYAGTNGQLTVNESLISGNTAEIAGGGIMTLLEADLTVTNSTISENISLAGGGIYIQDAGNFLFKGTTFSKNISDSNGGGLYLDDVGGIRILNCQFLENNTAFSGGGIYMLGGNMELTNTSFSKNKANYGGAISNNNSGSDIVINGGNFTENEVSENGGALEGYDGATYLIDNSIFTKNKANYGGGINLQLEGTTATVRNSQFTENEVEIQGGALSGFNGTITNVYSTSFKRNIANLNGGAVNISSDDIQNGGQIFDACIFDGNQAKKSSDGRGGYGSALLYFNADASITNCLFINNSSESGGIIQPNAYDEFQDVIRVTNCTFANNLEAGKASIYSWDDGMGDQVGLVLQNNIFADNNAGFANEEGTAMVTSNGGNLSINDLMTEVLTHAKDQNSTNPQFKEASNNFKLTSTSPAINAGVNTNAPEKDLAGNERDALVDIGAYESQEVTSLFKTIPLEGQINIYPNPVQNELNFSIESDWQGKFSISILNMKGQTIWENTAFKTTPSLQKTSSVGELPSGFYWLQIQRDRQKSSQLFIKE